MFLHGESVLNVFTSTFSLKKEEEEGGGGGTARRFGFNSLGIDIQQALQTDIPYRCFQVWLFVIFVCCIGNYDTEPTTVMSVV